jgi:MFS transporter, OFA family, oxalate/formate antiporter
MLSKMDAAQAARQSARRGWTVVASAFLIMFVMVGASYSFTAFFSPLQQTFGATRGDVSLAFSINVPLFYLMGAISGPLADRFGSRATCLFGIMLGSAGLMLAAVATVLWQIYVGFGLLLGVGIGFAFVPSVASVQRWFVKRRGLASGIAVSGIGFGTLLLPLVATPLIGSVGWRGTWSGFALLILIVGGGASLFISNSPEIYGALPDGGVVGLDAGPNAGSVGGVGIREAIMSRPFVLLYLSLIIIWSGVSIPFVHLVPYAEDHGLSHSTAVAIFGLVGIGSIGGRFMLGGVADRFGRRKLLAAAFGTIGLLQAWLLIGTSAWQISTFALVFGTCYGGVVALFPALTVDYFGGRHASGIIGVLYTSPAFGSFIGPKLAGDAYDKFGSYSIPIALGALSALVAAALVLAASEPPLKS